MKRSRAIAAGISVPSLFFLGLCLAPQVLGDNFVAEQSQAVATEASTIKFQPRQLLADFQIVRQALEEGHIGIYRYTSKAEIDRQFDKAAKSINQPMSVYEFYRILAPTIATIKCGHTRLSLPASIRQELDTRVPLLPLYVRVLDSKVYVLRDFSNASGALAGKEIRSVNGVPATKLVETMIAATPGDGDIQTSRQLLIGGWRFAEHLVTLFGLNSPHDLVLFDNGSQREMRVSVTGVELSKSRALWQTQFPQDQPSDRGAELKYYYDGKIAQLIIRNFEGFADGKRQVKLEDFLRETFQQFQWKRVEALIIDLRNNGGGYDHLGALLLAYLVEQPFKHYEDIVMNNRTFSFLKYAIDNASILENFLEKKPDGKYHLTGHPTWGIQQPAKPTFKGKVFVLINGRSFSTTSEFIAQTHFHRRAIFIGEEAGGGYSGNTAGFMPLLELPNTKLRLGVPLTAYYLAVKGSQHTARGVIPDYPVAYSIEELLSGQDKELDLALKLAHKS